MVICPVMSTMCDDGNEESDPYLADIECLEEGCELWMSPKECESEYGMCAFKYTAWVLASLMIKNKSIC